MCKGCLVKDFPSQDDDCRTRGKIRRHRQKPPRSNGGSAHVRCLFGLQVLATLDALLFVHCLGEVAKVAITCQNPSPRVQSKPSTTSGLGWHMGNTNLSVAIRDKSGELHLVMVEPKYFSGKSSAALDEDDVELAMAPSDQLAAEYEDLLTLERQLRLGRIAVKSRTLFYVTAHRSIPVHSFRRIRPPIQRFHPDLPAGPVYWTNWFALLPVISGLRMNLRNGKLRSSGTCKISWRRKGSIPSEVSTLFRRCPVSRISLSFPLWEDHLEGRTVGPCLALNPWLSTKAPGGVPRVATSGH